MPSGQAEGRTSWAVPQQASGVALGVEQEGLNGRAGGTIVYTGLEGASQAGERTVYQEMDRHGTSVTTKHASRFRRSNCHLINATPLHLPGR